MKIDDLKELEGYIFLLEDKFERVITNDKEVVELLKAEFDIDTTLRQIQVLRDPSFEEESIDRQLLLKNIYA